jgi:hypothetical protein
VSCDATRLFLLPFRQWLISGEALTFDMLTSLDARRRWFGAFFLILSLSLLIWGTTLLSDYLQHRPMLFIAY